MQFFNFVMSIFQVRKKLSALDSKISKLQSRKEKSELDISRNWRELENLEKRLTAELAKTRQTLAESQIINRKLEETLDGARDKLKTAEEITIPGLVAANQVFMQRWEAESRIHAMRATVADMGAQQREQ